MTRARDLGGFRSQRKDGFLSFPFTMIKLSLPLNNYVFLSLPTSATVIPNPGFDNRCVQLL